MSATMDERPFDAAAFSRRLTELLATASNEDELFKVLEPEWERALLWRCALAPRFDAATVAAVLAKDLVTPKPVTELYAWLALHPDLEETAIPTPTLAMRDGARGARLQQAALQVDAALAGRYRQTASQLAAHFGARGPEWALDGLSVLAVADPAQALRQARRSFEAASQAADFTRCFQLIRVLEGREPLLTALGQSDPSVNPYSALVREINELRRRYDTMRVFSTDFERTAQVLERDVMLEAWHWILPGNSSAGKKPKGSKEDRSWMLNIEAGGGSGKTVFLRWLSARRCLPAGVPYARLDFDFVDTRLTSVAPWYLLAQLARVLDPQLPGRPLGGLVARADDLVDIGRFALGPSEAAHALEQLRSSVADEVSSSISTDFAAILNEARVPAIVVVLDTLEVALLDPEANLLEFLRLLHIVRDNCPSLKVILSGRFDLGKRLDGFTEGFETNGHVRNIALTRLDAAEAMKYLVELRKLPDGPVARAIVKRCGGLPLALWLFADEWEINPKLSVREVKEIPGPELHYLVERVLRRIPPPIAWLLRYSVVARRLTRTFLAEVIVPELEEIRRGAPHDNFLRDPKIMAVFFDDARKALGEEVLSADRLWEELERHASAFSFVSRDESTDGALKLHDEVLRPMRRQLAGRRVMKRLHRAAMQLAMQKAGLLNPAREREWAAQQKEALYHALRLSPRLGQRLWERLDAQAVRRSAHEARRHLANELLDESVVVPSALRIAAAREKTEASIDLAERFGPGYAHHWTEASQALAKWRALLPSAKRAWDGRLAVARERIASRMGPASPSSVRRLQRLLKRSRDAAERLELHVALARCVPGRPAALRHVEAALGLLTTGKVKWQASKRFHFLLNASDECTRQGDYGRALQLTNRALAISAQLSILERINGLARLAWMLTTCRYIDRLGPVSARAGAIDAEIEADASLQEEEFLIARALLRKELSRGMVQGGPPAPAPLSLTNPPAFVTAIDLHTDAEAACYGGDASAALDCAGRARAAIPQGDTELVATLFSLVSTTATDVLGDMRQSRSALLAALATSIPKGSDPWWETRLGQCIHGERPEQALAEMRARCRTYPAPWSEAVVALATLALSRSQTEPKSLRMRRAGSTRLMASLKRIRPMAARRRFIYLCLPDVRLVPIDIMARDRLGDLLDLHRMPAASASDAAWTEHLALMAFAGWGPGEPHVMRNAGSVARCLSVAGHSGTVAICDDDALALEPSPLVRGMATFAKARHLSEQGDSAKAIALATAASALLIGEGVPPSIWSARAALLLYRLTVSSNPAAGSLLLTAEDTCERLGSELGLAEVRDARTSTFGADVAAVPESVFATMACDAHVLGGRSAIGRAMADDAAQSSARRTPERLIAELARDFPAAIRQCRDVLPRIDGPKTPALRLVILAKDPVSSALPWELAITHKLAQARKGSSVPFTPGWRHEKEPRSGVNDRWLARAFQALDMPAGAGDLPAVTRAFQERHGIPVTGKIDAATLRRLVRALREGRNPRVAVILTSPSYGPAGMVERIYHGQPADVSVARGGSGQVLKLLQSGPFDVVHVVAPAVESASFGGIAFNLADAGKLQSSGDRYLALSEMSSALKRPDNVLRPIVIVHNTLEKLPLREVIRQYVLRNLAAMELSLTGTPVATVAVSSTWYGSGEGGLYPVIEAILGGHPLIAAIDALDARRNPNGTPLLPRARARGTEAIARELMLFGTCVYANNPEFIAV